MAATWTETAPTRGLQNQPRSTVAEKLQDVIGLYLNPAQHAIVLSVDEKSQIQALDRTPAQPASQEGAWRNHDARLQTLRHNHAFCCVEWAGRQSLEPV